MSSKSLQEYFSYAGHDRIREQINQDVAGVPAIFYVVQCNNPGMARIWVAHGGNVNAWLRSPPIPLLAFAVILSAKIETDTTSLVSTLVSLGADASVIPQSLLAPFPDTQASELSDNLAAKVAWCSDSDRAELDRILNLTQRYVLHRHVKRGRLSARLEYVASELKATALLGLPYLIVGQEYAVKLLTDQILGYLLAPSDNPKPLVLFFAGPSGHGKSELGNLLGQLLSLQICSVDMAGMKYETDLFGPRTPFFGSEKGSPLNNFLANTSSQPAIVFLDEFEKSKQEVWDSLLIPIGEGLSIRSVGGILLIIHRLFC
jgi:hypothetical protein